MPIFFSNDYQFIISLKNINDCYVFLTKNTLFDFFYNKITSFQINRNI